MVRILALNTFILLSIYVLIRAHATQCDQKSICDSVNSSAPVGIRTSKGRTVNGQMVGEQRTKQIKCHGKECPYTNPARMTALFNDVKSRMSKVVLRGRSVDQASGPERAVLNALDKAVLLDPITNPSCKRACIAKGIAQRLGEGICICPVLEIYPDEFLIFTMAHEIGHYGDICASERTGLKPGQHPFERSSAGGSVISCLQENGIAGRSPTEGQTYRSNTVATGARLAGFDPNTTLGSVVGVAMMPLIRAVQPGNGSVHCRGPLGHSHMQEASADIFGFEVLGDFLKDHPLSRGDSSSHKRLFGLIGEMGCVQNEEGDPLDHHASGIDRITKIGMSIPSMREALNCSGHSAPLSCDYRNESSQVGPSQPAQSVR